MIYLPEVCLQPRSVECEFLNGPDAALDAEKWRDPSTWFHELRPTPSHVFKCPGEVNDKLRTDFTCIWELNWKIVCWNVRNQSCSHSYCFILAMAKEKDSILLGCSSSIKWLLTYLVEIKNGILLYVSNEPTGLWRKSFLCNSSNSGFYSFSLFQFPPKTSKTTIICINFDLETYPTGSGPGSLELHESSFIQLNSTLLSPFKRRKNKKIAVSAIDLYQRNDGSLGRFDVKCMILK